MKQFSIVLNVVLVVAVAILYYLHFKSDKKNNPVSNPILNTIRDSSGGIQRPIIAYVELDSVNSNVNYIKDRKKELEAEQKVIETDYKNEYYKLEEEKNTFLKRGNAITQQEAEAFQEKLGQKSQIIESNKQAQAQRLAEKGSKIMDEMQRKLKKFMVDYNKDKKYTYILATGTGLEYMFYKDSTLNITDDVVKGLNQEMK